MHCHKILVVEDDAAIQEALVFILASEGYEVVLADHGREAIELLKDRKEDPCLILTDLMMPEMDGWEFIKLLNEQDVVVTIPIVVMTAGLTNKSHGKKIVKKPFNLETVLKLVQEHCGPPNDGPVVAAQTSL